MPTFIKETLTDATFQDGATLSGSFVAEFKNGKLIGVTDANLVATAVGGASTTITALAPENTGVPVTGTTKTEYELTSTGTLTGPFVGIDIDFISEKPGKLAATDNNGSFTNIQSKNPNGTITSSALAQHGDGTIVPQVVCFFGGTDIATPTGDVAVETLTAGALVLTADGESRPVRWLGRQTVSTRFSDPLRVLPIRIKVGALGNGLPLHDLLVSPCHALLVDGVLVEAGALVNGLSIAREPKVPEIFTYYHVELEDHSLILAAGVAAETFVDNVNRMGFDNWAEHEALELDASIPELDYPRARSARQLPMATRTRLLQLAGNHIDEEAAA